MDLLAIDAAVFVELLCSQLHSVQGAFARLGVGAGQRLRTADDVGVACFSNSGRAVIAGGIVGALLSVVVVALIVRADCCRAGSQTDCHAQNKHNR